MKTKLALRRLAALLLLSTINHQLSTWAQGTAFTYQGRLTVGGNSSTNGSYDFQFQVFDTAGVPPGNSLGSPNPNSVNGVAVSNGLFTVTLNFGTGVFTGPDRWLQIFVRTNGNGAYTTLSPREPLTPTPYAIFAAGAASANGVGSGSISSPQLNTPGGPTSGQVLSYNGTSLFWTSLNSAGGLTLPYSGTASSSGSLFTLNNTGSGPAAAFLGNVGIGTTIPSSTLHISSSSSSPYITVDAQDTGHECGINLNRNGTRQWSVFRNDTTEDFAIEDATENDNSPSSPLKYPPNCLNNYLVKLSENHVPREEKSRAT